jgi:hypothetical protein
VAERLRGGESVCRVTRPHGLSPQAIVGLRRQARQSAVAGTDSGASQFMPGECRNGIAGGGA